MRIAASAQLLISAALLVGVACQSREQGASPSPEPTTDLASARRVRVDPKLLRDGRVSVGSVELRDPSDELRATGAVEPDVGGAADVGALVLSVARAVHVREGDRVRLGQLLAELTAPDAARVAGELSKARSRRVRAEQALARERRLILGQATSRRELEDAEADLSGIVAEERAARRMLAAFGANGARISVRAPIAGVVTHSGVILGAQVEAGDKLFRIVDPEQLMVRAEVLERDAHRVHPGDAATLQFPGGKTCDAEVAARGMEVEPERRTVSVRLLPKACALPIAGQTLDVRLLPKPTGKPTHVAVPRDALVELDGVPVVFTATSSPEEFELFPVVVARLSEHTAFLSKGPAPGSAVAVHGTILLKGEWMRGSLE